VLLDRSEECSIEACSFAVSIECVRERRYPVTPPSPRARGGYWRVEFLYSRRDRRVEVGERVNTHVSSRYLSEVWSSVGCTGDDALDQLGPTYRWRYEGFGVSVISTSTARFRVAGVRVFGPCISFECVARVCAIRRGFQNIESHGFHVQSCACAGWRSKGMGSAAFAPYVSE